MKFKNLLMLPLLIASLQAASVDDLTITLNGDSTEYTVTDCDTTASGSLEIPTTYNSIPVTSIGSYAFNNCTSLSSITIPDSVTSIGDVAFSACYSLSSITIGNSVTSIGDHAFNACTSLSSITIGNSVTSIGSYAFQICTSLTSIIIPDSVTSIEDFAFNGCSNLSSITIGNSVTSIGDHAFKGSSLVTIIFGGNAPLVGSQAFAYIGDGFSEPVIYYYNDATGFTSPTWRGVQTEMLIRDTTPPLNNFYESNIDESISIDATPPDNYPTGYTYQWYFNGFTIPSFLGGTSPSYTIEGKESSNGIWRVEVTYDAGTTSAEFEYRVFADADGDGLSDYRESNILSTNPSLPDTDNDGLNDYEEVNTHSTNPSLADTDSDGLNDGNEVNTYGTNPLDSDSDDDGLTDGVEVNTYSTDPNDTDSDDDEVTDADEVNIHLTNPNLSDSDGDQLSDYSEINSHLTNPNDSDSDNDGLSDGNEVNTHSSNPLSEDTSGDGFTDGFVVAQGADPSLDYSAFRAESVDITDALNESRLLGQQDVTGDPGTYELYTATEVAEASSTSRLQGQQDVTGNPSAYELFTKSQLMDLKPSSTLIEVTNNEAIIDLEMQQSNDLQTWSKVGESISMTVPADTNTKFFRHAFSNSNSSDETSVEFTFIGTNNHDFATYYGNEAVISAANIPLYETDSDNYYSASFQVIEWSSDTPIGGSQYGRPTVTVATTSSLVGHNLKIRFFKYDSNNANNFTSAGPTLTIDGDALALQEQTVVATSGIGVASQLGYSVRVWKEAKP